MENGIYRLDESRAKDFWNLRKKLFEELGETGKGDDITDLELSTTEYYLSHINNDLICWGVLREGKTVSIGSLCLFDRIPYKKNPGGSEGYILNVYTLPQFRGRGFAGLIIDNIIKFSRENNIKRL